jgi:putative transposase
VDEHARWLKRDLSVKRYVYFWADGIHVQARLEDDAQCLLVIIGATPEGNKELVGLTDGERENAQSWKGLFCRGARQFDRGVLRRKKSQRGEMS